MKNKLLILFIFLFIQILININFFNASNLENFLEKNSDFEKIQEKLPQTLQIGDIYKQAYNLSQKTYFFSDKTALDYTLEYTNLKYKCSLNKTDIYNIFQQTDYGKILKNMQAIREKTSLDAVQPKFVDSCKKFISCIGGFETKYSNDSPIICKNLIINSYIKVKDNIFNAQTISQENYGDDIFVNGTLDDSSYDLLVDIEDIGKILFHENKPFEKFNLYRGFSGKLNGNNLVGNLSNFNNGNLDISNLFENIFNNNQNNTGNNIGLNLSDMNNNNIISQQNIGNLDFNANFYNSSIVNDFQCIDKSLNGSYNYTNQNTGNNQNLNINGFTGNINYLRSTQDIQKNLDDFRNILFNLSGGNEHLSVLDNCTKKCDGYSSFDKALCKAQCMCNVSTSIGEIFSIRFCLIPSQKKGIVGSKSIMAVEEILNESVNVLDNMKSHGALMKHRSTDEWWEVSLPDIKLSELFTFDFVLAWKPIFTRDDKKEEKKEKEKQVEQNKNLERYFLGNYGDLNVKAEVNKYCFGGEGECGNQGYNTIGYLLNTVKEQKQSEINDTQSDNTNYEISKTAQQNINYEIMSQVKDFIENNIRLWENVFEQIKGIEDISNTLKNNIKAGN